VGLVIGVISATLGIGGGVLMVPILVFFFGFDQSRAIGTTLGILSLPVGVGAAWEYYRQGRLDIQAAGFIALAFVVGAYGGARLQPFLPVHLLRLLFGLLLVYIAMRFLGASDPDRGAGSAFLGLLAVAVAWLGYLAFRALGRRHLARPDLGESIRGMAERRGGETDYHI
jgi:uncharacterized membrane protein YfcA